MLELQYSGHLMQRAHSLEKTLMLGRAHSLEKTLMLGKDKRQEETGAAEDEMVG